MKPRNIGRYQVKAELNRGGMSVVYLAHDPRFGRDVAIKMLPRSLQDQSAVRARFEREARTVAALENPAIVPVYDFGEEDGQPYLVMRCMQGGSLADLLTYGRLNLIDASHIMSRMAGALDEAHERGIVHRDLKPGNILFDTHGEAFLTDFGIVKLYEGDANVATMTGSVVLGTPAYMSPEQALGKTIDRRSDIYSLGAVLYEMLTGVPPYKGPTSISIAMKHVVEPVPDVREYRPDLPDACIAVVEKAMAKEPGDRYATASEMATAFAQAAVSAATTEKQMPPVVVRKKPQTTSNTIKAADEDDSSTPTTEMSRPSTQSAPMDESSGGRRWGLTAAVVAGLLLLFGASVAAFGVLSRQNRGAQPTATVPSPTVLATTVVMPTREPLLPTATIELVISPASILGPSPTLVPSLRVTTQDANVRTGPGTSYPVITTLAAASEVQPTAVTSDPPGQRWFVILLSSGEQGWISETVVIPANAEVIDALPTVAITPTPPPSPTSASAPRPTATLAPLLQTATPTPTPTATLTPTPDLDLPPTPVPLPTQQPTSTVETSTPSPTPTLPAASPTPTSLPTESTPTTPTTTPTPTPTLTPVSAP